MRKRAHSFRASRIAGWLMVAASCLGAIGLAVGFFWSTPALGASSNAAPLAAGATRYQETDPHLVYSGVWKNVYSRSCSGGSEKYALRALNSVTVTFYGTSLSWLSTTTPSSGIARVTRDGAAPVLLDLYSSTMRYRRVVYSTGPLAAGYHTVKIQWTGSKNVSARNNVVHLDALDVVGSLVSARTAVTTTSTTGAAGATTTTAAPVTATTEPVATSTTISTTTSTTETTTTTTTASTTTTTAAKVYNVVSYGAKGDGVTDDAPAIQNAINAAKNAGGGVVYLPAGTYRLYAARSVDADLGANLELFDGVTVKGAGPASTVVVADRDFASAFGAIRRNNLGVRDLTLTAGASKQDGVKFGVCTGAVIQNVVAHDIYIGIALYSCTNGIVRGCKVYNCSGAGIWIGQGETWTELSVGGLMEDCEGWGTSFTAFRVAGNVSAARRATGVTLRRCYSHNSGTQNFLFTYAASVTVDDCTSSTAGSGGIRFTGVTGGNVVGSTTPFVSTSSNDPSMYAVYGASSNILVQ